MVLVYRFLGLQAIHDRSAPGFWSSFRGQYALVGPQTNLWTHPEFHPSAFLRAVVVIPIALWSSSTHNKEHFSSNQGRHMFLWISITKRGRFIYGFSSPKPQGSKKISPRNKTKLRPYLLRRTRHWQNLISDMPRNPIQLLCQMVETGECNIGTYPYATSPNRHLNIKIALIAIQLIDENTLQLQLWFDFFPSTIPTYVGLRGMR